jgi:hypothetical protein
MQTVGKFNTISEDLMKSIPQLEVGQAVTFEMLTGVKNNDPDEKERQRNPVLYPKANIPTRDRIKDPYLAKQGKDAWVEIVVADYWDKERPIERLFVPGLSDGVTNFQFGGKFSLVGGNQRDEELYEYLMITNFNQDSILGEGRDTSKIPLFKLVNTKAASQKTLTGFANYFRLNHQISCSKNIITSAGKFNGRITYWPRRCCNSRKRNFTCQRRKRSANLPRRMG